VSDALDGLVAVLDRFDACVGEVYNIGTETTHTTGEAVEVSQHVVGKPAVVEAAPPRPGDQLKTHANIDNARRVLDYDPGTSLRDGVRELVRWCRTTMKGELEFL
jgi:nucleoside-diphosphate-sugar epimerase